MADYDNRNTFVLFRNKNKSKPTSPDFSGTFTDDDGREYFFDAWSKEPKGGGEKFLSGKRGNLKTKQATPAPRRETAQSLDDEMPF